MLGTAHRNHRILFGAESKCLWRMPGDGRDDRSIVHTGHVTLGSCIIFANHNHVEEDLLLPNMRSVYMPQESQRYHRTMASRLKRPVDILQRRSIKKRPVCQVNHCIHTVLGTCELQRFLFLAARDAKTASPK